MKTRSLAILLILIYNLGITQKSNLFRIDFIPKEGILLDKGWKWCAGDNPDWAKPEFDDTKWEETNVTDPMLKGSKILEAEISWFRKTIEVDSSLIYKPLIIDLNIYGAAEIFMNGQLIHKLGQVSKDPNIEKTFTPPFNMPYSFLFNKAHNVLAIRFSFTRSNLYLPDYISSQPFDFTIKKPDGFTEKLVEKHSKYAYENAFLLGIFLTLSLLHLAFYYYYPKVKTSLFLGITMLLRAGYFLHKFITLYPTSTNVYTISEIIQDILFVGYYTLLILCIHRYLKKPLTLYFWFAITILILGYIAEFFDFRPTGILSTSILFVYYVYMTRIDIKQGKKEALLLYYAGILGLIGFMMLTFTRYSRGSNILTVENLMFLDKTGLWIVYLCIPIALSLTLARDFALTSLSLQKEFDENKKLLEEKQQILSSQNETLEKQVEQRTTELKASQDQLIQKEKLASLGELTAGIAHEIQNPLNFVNNFSELNNELIKELEEETRQEIRDANNEKEILTLLKENSEKINLHGQRASSIVKGMLEHSRKSSGIKEPTNINQLCDEYVRLSYHGLRARDKDFNCDYKLDLDPNWPLVNVVTQDIGRVILNIVNNAFQACAEKQQFLNNNGNSIKNQKNNDQAPDSPSGGGGEKNSKDNLLLPPTPEGEQNFVYHPVVSISTKIQGNKIEIRIHDNGPGIPENIKDKIFQPFFTTKPTGQGTGLGLSLAYDIVKAHGGELKVKTLEGKGSEFIIHLPIS